jgi:hypothetical protein
MNFLSRRWFILRFDYLFLIQRARELAVKYGWKR